MKKKLNIVFIVSLFLECCTHNKKELAIKSAREFSTKPILRKTTGTIQSFFQCDLWHLDIKSEQGQIIKFICGQGCDLFEAPNQKKYIGSRATVEWIETKMNFPDGGIHTIKKTVVVAILK